MMQGRECINKPGKSGMEPCQLAVKNEHAMSLNAPCFCNGIKVEGDEERTRLMETLELTQRQVDTLQSDVIRLKAEQRDSDQVIFQLQQANKAQFQRLDELQTRCDQLEKQSRRTKASEPEKFRHDAAVALLTLSDSSNSSHAQDDSEWSSQPCYCKSRHAVRGNGQTLSGVYGALLQYPVHDFCNLLGNKQGSLLYGTLHGTLCRSDTVNFEHEDQPPMDLRKRRLSLADENYNSLDDSTSANIYSESSHNFEYEECGTDSCHPMDLSYKPIFVSCEGMDQSGYEREPMLEDDIDSDLPPLQIDLGAPQDNESGEEHERGIHESVEQDMDQENITSFTSAIVVDEQPEHSLTAKMASYSRRRKRGPKSWEFLMRLMADKRTNPSVIRWEDRESATVRLIQPHYIAKLWGKRSGKTDLTYDHFARALRYHYKKGQLIKVSERQLVYGCGPEALKFLSYLLQQNQLLEASGDGIGHLDPLEPIPKDHTYVTKDELCIEERLL